LNARLSKDARRWRPWLVRGLALLCVLGLGYLVVRATLPGPPAGGLDGCLRSTSGAPLTARVRVAGQSIVTASDGCFFFASVPAGPQIVIVDATGQTGEWQRKVDIVADQAVGLGDVTVAFSEAKP